MSLRDGDSPVSLTPCTPTIDHLAVLTPWPVGNQVTPFKLDTSDGERLYAWHLLPLPLYLQNEASLAARVPGFADDVTTTESFRLLKHDPEARLVLYCKRCRSAARKSSHLANPRQFTG